MPFTRDPLFWRAGAISSVTVMVAILVFLTADTLHAMTPGETGSHVPPYTVINQRISYEVDPATNDWRPVVGRKELIFDHEYTPAEAADLMRKGKLVLQSRACMSCHTVFGNGGYYAPDLTKSWLDPVWQQTWMPVTQKKTKDEAIAAFLMHPERYPTWSRQMPNLNIQRDEAIAMVAYLKWLSAIDTNGFPNNFGQRNEGR